MRRELPNAIIEQGETETIQDIVKRVIEGNSEYSADLLELIPEELLSIAATDENLQETADKLDAIRSEKEEEFWRKFWERTAELEKLGEFTEKDNAELKKKREKSKKELRFLFNVAASALHQ